MPDQHPSPGGSSSIPTQSPPAEETPRPPDEGAARNSTAIPLTCGPDTSPSPEHDRWLAAATPLARLGRYELLGEIARGGMGCVLRARDPDLNRELAIKVLLDRHQHTPDVKQRFVEEAQIGGQLQHPGLVPVHEIGALPDGRAYFTMKLVRGRTLASLLEERTDLVRDLPRFLGILELICQTMGFAHSRGVIHRDLEPSNIMVGAFGEVQVVDWGLAKVLRGGSQEECPGGSPSGDVIRTVLPLRTGPGGEGPGGKRTA